MYIKSVLVCALQATSNLAQPQFDNNLDATMSSLDETIRRMINMQTDIIDLRHCKGHAQNPRRYETVDHEHCGKLFKTYTNVTNHTEIRYRKSYPFFGIHAQNVKTNWGLV